MLDFLKISYDLVEQRQGYKIEEYTFKYLSCWALQNYIQNHLNMLAHVLPSSPETRRKNVICYVLTIQPKPRVINI